MKVLIVEDEYHAINRLRNLIQSLRSRATILATLDSIEDTVHWLKFNTEPDLIFLDIQLADGLSFDIFTQVQPQCPIIFTTAFDDYALRAFKLNSIDYLLKPIDDEELERAISKFERWHFSIESYNPQDINQLIQSLVNTNKVERFLVKIGQQLLYVNLEDIAYFTSENSLTLIYTNRNQKYIIDYSLDQLEKMLPDNQFFRINRKMIIKLHAIQEVSTYFNSRLIVNLAPKTRKDVIVSRERVREFKVWLGA